MIQLTPLYHGVSLLRADDGTVGGQLVTSPISPRSACRRAIASRRIAKLLLT